LYKEGPILEEEKSNGVIYNIHAPRDAVTSLIKNFFLPKIMGAAIGFAAILIVLGVFLPDVLNGLKELFLILIEKATAFVSNLP